MPGQGEQFLIYSSLPKTKNEDYTIKKETGTKCQFFDIKFETIDSLARL